MITRIMVFLIAYSLLAFSLGYDTGRESKQPAAPKCKPDVVRSFNIKLVAIDISCKRRYFI